MLTKRKIPFVRAGFGGLISNRKDWRFCLWLARLRRCFLEDNWDQHAAYHPKCLYDFTILLLILFLVLVASSALAWVIRRLLGSDMSWNSLRLSLGWCVEHMLSFDIPARRTDVTILYSLKYASAIVLYFVTWLISGGGLVSIIVSRTRQFNTDAHNGDLRFCKDQFDGHLVFLGWREDNIEIIRQRFVEACSSGVVLILSRKNAEDIYFQLREIMADFPQVAFIAYHGNIDSDKEQAFLNVEKADVVISGEEDDLLHDEHVISLNKHFRDNRQLNATLLERHMRARLDSFSLYCEYLKEYGSECQYFNFYHEWAKRIVANGPIFRDDVRDAHLVIFGFPVMGQALALETALANRAGKLYITVFDHDVKPREMAFREQFPLLDQMERVYWSFVDQTAGCDTLSVSSLNTYAEKHSLTIALIGDDTVSAMSYRHKIRRKVNNIPVLMFQYAGEADVSDYSESAAIKGEGKLQLFGFSTGAGFSARTYSCDESELKILGFNKLVEKRSAKDCLNPYMSELKSYAQSRCNELARQFAKYDVTVVLGGALAYDASLRGSYDIDLRILVEDWRRPTAPIGMVSRILLALRFPFVARNVRRRIDKIRDVIVLSNRRDKSFSGGLLTENGSNYIWHFTRGVKVPGLPKGVEVELSVNVQGRKGYGGIAVAANRLKQSHQDVLDRYINLKWNARLQGEMSYRHLKEEWRKFMCKVSKECDKCGIEQVSDGRLSEILGQLRQSREFRLFLS